MTGIYAMKNGLIELCVLLGLGMCFSMFSAPAVAQTGNSYPGLAVGETITFTCLADAKLGSCVGINDINAKQRVLVNGIGEPCALEYDRQGNLYIGTDTRDSSGAYALYEYTADRELINRGYIIRPQYRANTWNLDLAISNSGEVYFTHLVDKTRGTGVSKINAKGEITLVVDNIGEPSALEFDSKGNLYIGTDTRNPEGVYAIYKLMPTGKLTNLGRVMDPFYTAGTWSFDLAISDRDEVYFTHLQDKIRGTGVSKLDANGHIQLILNGIGEPCALAFDHTGNLYVGTDTRSDGYHLIRWNARGSSRDYGRLMNQLYNAASWTLDLAFSPKTAANVSGGKWAVYR